MKMNIRHGDFMIYETLIGVSREEAIKLVE